jgi:hypothetical protein
MHVSRSKLTDKCKILHNEEVRDSVHLVLLGDLIKWTEIDLKGDNLCG